MLLKLKLTPINIVWILFYFFIFSFFLNNGLGYLDPDFGWHLKVGQDIWQTKELPHSQLYMWTLGDQTWVDHEWLINLLIYIIYSFGGYITLSIFFALIIVFSLWLVNRNIFKTLISNNDIANYALIAIECFGLYGVQFHFGVRMQEISFLCLTILLILIHKFDQDFKFKAISWIIPLIYLWSCLHGGFLISFAVLGFYLSFLLLKILLLKFEKKSCLIELKKFKLLTLASLIAFLSTLVTPYGLELYRFLNQYTNTAYMNLIQEWRGVYTIPIIKSQIFYQVFIVSILTIISVNKNSIKILFNWRYLLTLIFFIMSFKSVRHFPLFFITSLILLIPDIFKNNPHFKFKNWQNIFISLTILLLTSLFFLSANYNSDPFVKSYCSSYPCQAVNFLKTNHLLKEKFYNPYDWGGYLIWTNPSKKLFLDGRLPQYPYSNHTIIEEYLEFNNPIKLETKLTQHQINIILIKLNNPKIILSWLEKIILSKTELSIIAKINADTESSLLKYLKTSSQWQIVYYDNISAIYIKK